jgi:hypothetical protein
MITKSLLIAGGIFTAMSVSFAQAPKEAVDAARPSQTGCNSAQNTGSNKTQGQSQPQGQTGPISTSSGGAPAESPQGETPAGMQHNAKGSSQGPPGQASSEHQKDAANPC